MAETTPPAAPARSPALPSTADAAPYVPVSWMAVAAAVSGLLLAVVLLVSGIGAFRGGRPLLQEWLLFPAAITIVLSFAARRVVRNAEGTRTGNLFGVDLISGSWWLGLLLGLGYCVYLFAVDYSIRRDAEGEVQRWTGNILKGETTRAFHRTLDPGRRANTAPDDEGRLMAEFREPFVGFRQCDLVRLAERNRGECEFIPGNVIDWRYPSNGIECVVAASIRCREGTFPFRVPMKAVESTAANPEATTVGRQWMVVVPSSGFIQHDKKELTSYGWLVEEVEKQGELFGKAFLRETGQGPVLRLYSYVSFTHTDDPFLLPFTPAGIAARYAVLGPVAIGWTPAPEYYKYTAGRLFKLPGAKKPEPAQDEQFETIWRTVGFSPPATRLKDSLDLQTRIVLGEKEVEVYLPLEMPVQGLPTEIVAARGRVVVSCNDPELLAELKRRRDAAPAEGSVAEMPPGTRRPLRWKLDRVESDLKPIKFQMPSMPGGGPPPGGGPGGGPPGMGGP